MGWTDSTRDALVDRFGFSSGSVVVLEQPNSDEVRQAFAALGEQIGDDDTFYLFLIGHGSFDGSDYKFNIARTDLSGAEYSELLAGLGAGRSVVINSTTSSGGSIEALRGPNRVIVTATRSGTERNDTVFYDHFLEALADGASDEDLNERVSVWEAFRYATLGVTRHYEELNLLATEHAQISDNGAEQTGIDATQPATLAQLTNFNTRVEREVEDPVLRALLAERSDIENRLAQLQAARESIPAGDYTARLEALLIELSLKSAEIREREALEVTEQPGAADPENDSDAAGGGAGEGAR
jgi:hypothetical protein